MVELFFIWFIMFQTAQVVPDAPFKMWFIIATLMGLPFTFLFGIYWMEKWGEMLEVPMKGFQDWINCRD